MAKLVCEFRRVNPEQFLGQFEMAQAPATNELININGDPYLVLERKWAIGTELEHPTTYCYLAVVRFK